MTPELTQKILGCKTLPTLPAVAVRILDLAANPSSSAKQVAECIESDPAVAARVLKTVNSSFYARRVPVSTINQAVVILGLQTVKTLVLGFCLVGSMSGLKVKGFDVAKFWRRTIHTSTAARLLAQRLGEPNPEEWALTALLADIGMLVLDMVDRPTYTKATQQAETHMDLPAQEAAAGLATHAEVGYLIAEQWHLPPLLTLPIRWHHEPEQCPEPEQVRSCRAIQWAGLCGDIVVDAAPEKPLLMLRAVSEKLGISHEDADAIVTTATQKAGEVARLFDLKIGTAANITLLLQKANLALTEIALNNEQIAQQESMRAAELERQNSDLEHRNRELQQLALTDPLTGLANRAGSDRYMDAEFAQATRTGKPMALMVIDLDDFKHLNDTYGHAAGDQILRHVANCLKSATRDKGLAGRFGGDEMVVILPGVTLANASAIAGVLCRAIADKAVMHEGKWLKITVSIGVVSMEPGQPMATIGHLFTAADRAVYKAKVAGRNCVHAASSRAAA